MDIVSVIKKTHYYQAVEKIITNEQEEKLLEITSSLALLTHVANADRDVDTGEVSYIKRYIKKYFSIDIESVNKLVYGFNFMYQKEKPATTVHTACKKLLNETFNDEQKNYFLEALLSLSCADKEMAKIEKSFIRNISLALDLDKQDVMEKILSKNLDLLRQIDAEIAADPSLKTTVEELNEITFASAYEFVEDLNK